MSIFLPADHRVLRLRQSVTLTGRLKDVRESRNLVWLRHGDRSAGKKKEMVKRFDEAKLAIAAVQFFKAEL